jgi:hypothetical protein
MSKDLSKECVVATLAAQGVATESARAQNYASALSLVLKAAAPAYAQIAFEEEPAGFVAEQRRNAP